MLRALRLVWQSSPWLTSGLAALLVGSVFTATGRMIAAGLVVAAIPAAAAGAVSQLPVMLALYGVVIVTDALLNAAQRAQAQHLQVRVDELIDRRAMALSLGPAGIAHVEDAAHADLMKVALGPPRRTDHLLTWLPGVIQPRLVAVGMAIVLVHIGWWAPLLLLGAAWVRYRTSRLLSDSLHHSLSAAAPALRRSDYFRTLAVEPSAAREVRVFGLAEWLAGRMSETWREAMADVWRGRRGPMLASVGGVAAVIAAEAVVLLYIAWRAANGHIDLAALVTSTLAAITLSGVGWVGSYDHLLREALTAANALFELEKRVQSLLPRGRRSAATEHRMAGDIRFENVTFTYPGSRAPVLEGLDLRIAAGSSLAIVGANGAGKTTLIKLLARLYEPAWGRITIGGLDLSQLEPNAWRRQVAIVFQDFIQYPLSLRDNIGSGDVEQALLRAGGGDLLEKLPGGLDTVLSREFEGGVDLSGGEWQKVALARALAALDHASLLVLDEPTASLDVRSERELFARVQDLARGKTTILISHRLSSVRRADRICVLDGGRVAEIGTHEELLAKGGIYARMFHLQADHFEEAATAAEPPAPARAAAGDAAVPARARAPRGQRRRISLAGLRSMLSGSFRASPRLFLLTLLLVPVSGIVGPLQSVWAKDMVEGWRLQDSLLTYVGASLLVATIGAWLLIQLAGNHARNVLQERVGFAFDHQIAVLTAGIPGLAHHELPAYLDQLYVFRARARILGVLLQQLLSFLYELISFPTTLILLATVDLRLLIFVPVAAIALRVKLRSRVLLQRAQDQGAAANRLADRLLTLATSTAAASELRCSNREQEIIARQQAARRAAVRPVIRAQWQMGGLQALSGSLSSLTLVAAFLLALFAGHVGTGGLFLAFLLANRAVAHITSLMTALNQVGNLLYTAERFRWLSDYASTSHEAAAAATLTAPRRLQRGISIRNVRFRYPGTEGVVLEDLDLEVPAGSVLALIGENGAGKSTLVKLLCGFYTPDSGQVLIDGIDLRLIAASDWRSRISAGFQDFCRFELLAAETVAVGDVPRLGDRQLVASALERAGASDLPPRLPHALETQLGRRWRDGVELSTGQWQKLALGRAMMRRDPLLLFLDEPTASLDADAEFRLFERFTEAARRNRETGAITVLVSHRFSTVRAADVIVVFERGRIAEVGSHGQLMDRDGLYAQLYRLQASGYQ